jgi:hypothetical protein
MSSPPASDEIDKHVLRRYDIAAKLGKGVRLTDQCDAGPFESPPPQPY